MNIIDILHKLGYDVLSFNTEIEEKKSYDILGCIYKVQFSKERLAHKRLLIEQGDVFDYDINGTWMLHVIDVGFNGLGNLYVVFGEVGKNDTFDIYEYRNNDKEY